MVCADFDDLLPHAISRLRGLRAIDQTTVFRRLANERCNHTTAGRYAISLPAVV